jgi:hypothetical protein
MVTTSQDKVFIRETIDKFVNSMGDEECRVLLGNLNREFLQEILKYALYLILFGKQDKIKSK